MAIAWNNKLQPRVLPVENAFKPETITNEQYDDIDLQMLLQKQFGDIMGGKRLLNVKLGGSVKDTDGKLKTFHRADYDDGDGTGNNAVYYWGDDNEGAYGYGMGEGNYIFKGIPLDKYKNKNIYFDRGHIVRKK